MPTSTPTWTSSIYQIHATDTVLGGPDGVINLPASQLASRTEYLKSAVEAAGGQAAAAEGKADSALASITSIQQAAGAASTNAAAALQNKNVTDQNVALTIQARDAALSAQSQAGDNAALVTEAKRVVTEKSSQSSADASAAVDAAGIALASKNTAVQAKDAAVAAMNTTLAALAQMQYAPPVITSLLIDGASSSTVEQGLSVASVGLTWTLTGSAPESQSINSGIGSVPVGTLSKAINGPFTTSQSWTLSLTDTSPSGQPATVSASVGLNFRQRRHWGVSTLSALTSSNILGLTGNEFATSRGKSITYNATGGRYVYYAFPASFGALAGVTVGGLPFSDYTESIVSHTNAAGYTENYRVLRFNNLQNGSNISVVWS